MFVFARDIFLERRAIGLQTPLPSSCSTAPTATLERRVSSAKTFLAAAKAVTPMWDHERRASRDFACTRGSSWGCKVSAHHGTKPRQKLRSPEKLTSQILLYKRSIIYHTKTIIYQAKSMTYLPPIWYRLPACYFHARAMTTNYFSQLTHRGSLYDTAYWIKTYDAEWPVILRT